MAMAADAPQIAVAPPVRMPMRRRLAERAGGERAERRWSRRRRATTARRCASRAPPICSKVIRAPSSATPKRRIRRAEKSTPALARPSTRRIERHAEQERVEQRRPAAVLGNERGRDRDDDASRARARARWARPRQRVRSSALRRRRSGRRSSGPRLTSAELADEFLAPRPFAVARSGIEVADGAHVDELAAPGRGERLDTLVTAERIVGAGRDDAREGQRARAASEASRCRRGSPASDNRPAAATRSRAAPRAARP